MIEASQADQMPAIRDGLQGFRETEKRRMRQMVKLLARAFFGLHEVIISQRLRNSYSSSSHLARSKHLAAIGTKRFDSSAKNSVFRPQVAHLTMADSPMKRLEHAMLIHASLS